MTLPPGDPQWNQPAHGQQFGYAGYQAGYQPVPQFGPYGPPPARPGSVIAAAVLGFLFGALGIVVTLGAIVLGSLAGSLDDDSPAGFDEFADAAAGIALVLGLLALAWTVLLIWGSVWALTGRSRVLLLVGGSMALFFTTLAVLGSLSSTSGGDVVVNLLLVAGALAIVLLLSLRPAAEFFAAHRARRGG